MYGVGLDIGRSGAKVSIIDLKSGAIESRPIIPSKAKPIGIEQFHVDDQKNEWITRYAGKVWAIGSDADTHGMTPETNLQLWHREDDYWALTQGIIERLNKECDSQISALCAGLPSEAGEAERSYVKNRLAELMPGVAIKVVPQPVGVFMTSLKVAPHIKNEGVKVLIVDIGRYSADFLVAVGGSPSPESLKSGPGIAYAVEELAKIVRPRYGNFPFEKLEEVLITKRLKNFKHDEDLSREVSAILDFYETQEIHRLIDRIVVSEYKNNIDAIIIAGGSAELLNLEKHYNTTIKPEGGRHAISNGLAMVARMIASK